MESPAMIFFALCVFTVITSINSAASFTEDKDEATAMETAPEKRGYISHGSKHCYPSVSIQRFSKNLTCFVRFKANGQFLE